MPGEIWRNATAQGRDGQKTNCSRNGGGIFDFPHVIKVEETEVGKQR